MQRPNPGRRRRRTGSVPVPELLQRNLSYPIAEAGSGEHTHHHVHPMIRVGKVAGLGTGALALCGAVAVASTITTQRQQAPTPTTSAVNLPVELSGARALRPDALAAQLAPHATSPEPPADLSLTPERGSPANPGTTRSEPPTTAGTVSTSHARSSTTQRSRQQVTRTSASETRTAATTTGPGGSQAPSDVVTTFYSLLRSRPDEAATMLSPSLVGSSTDFVRSWSNTRGLRVEKITDAGNGTVQAVVQFLQQDGSWLRVRELLTIGHGPQPVITGAKLLGAQHG